MTIIHVCESFGGGIIDFIYYLTKYLPQYNHILIYGKRPEDDIKIKLPDYVDLIEWSNIGRNISMNDLKASKYLLRKLNRIEFDVLHLHSSKAGFIGRIISPFLNKRVNILFTPNGASFERKDIGSLTRFFFKSLEKIAANTNSNVVCVSKSESETFKKIGVDSFYINNGIEIELEKIRSPRKINKLIIISIGRITYQKNPKLFNSIANDLLDYDIEFIWIGDGEMKSELTSPNITVTGWLTKQNVLEIIEDGHVYLSTALWEGLPFSILYAMSYSIPLILFNSIGNIDLVENNFNGYIFNNKEEAKRHIIDLFNNKSLLNEMGDNSLKLVKKSFNVLDMALKYKEAYLGNFDQLNKPYI